MPGVISCGVLLWNRERVFACRATGTQRWDLPKGVMDPGETPCAAALREAWEEAGLRLQPEALIDLGEFTYLRGKRLHLYALHAGDDAVDLARCRCRTYFEHRLTRRLVPEADAYAWQALADREHWAGKGLAKVLGILDLARVRALPPVGAIEVDSSPENP